MNKISVIVPVYNGEKFIGKCLESILNQSIINDIKIIVVNDGSTDRSEEIILEYLNKYKNNIEYYIKKNGGLSSARNFGIKQCNCKYIGFVDSDDYIDKFMFEKLYKEIEFEKSDIAICGAIKCKENGEIISYIKKGNKENISREEALNRILGEKMESYAWNKLYKSELFLNNKIQYPNGRLYEDVITTYRLIKHSTKVTLIGEQLYYYVQHNESICYNPSIKMAMDMLLNLEDILNEGEVNEIFIANIITNSYTAYCRSCFNKKAKINKEELKSYKKRIKYYAKRVCFFNVVKDMSFNKYNKFKFILFKLKVMKLVIYLRVLNENINWNKRFLRKNGTK